jgi:hypothetical protein
MVSDQRIRGHLCCAMHRETSPWNQRALSLMDGRTRDEGASIAALGVDR